MEVIKTIIEAKQEHDIEEGCFIHLECWMCGEETHLAERDKKELIDKINLEGWKYLYSDEYQTQGWYCGCEYDVTN